MDASKLRPQMMPIFAQALLAMLLESQSRPSYNPSPEVAHVLWIYLFLSLCLFLFHHMHVHCYYPWWQPSESSSFDKQFVRSRDEIRWAALSQQLKSSVHKFSVDVSKSLLHPVRRSRHTTKRAEKLLLADDFSWRQLCSFDSERGDGLMEISMPVEAVRERLNKEKKERTLVKQALFCKSPHLKNKVRSACFCTNIQRSGIETSGIRPIYRTKIYVAHL